MASPLIVPSVLPADFARLGDVCRDLEKAGVDRIQFDVMDNTFVPNLTFGAATIASVRSWVEVPFEAHLMVEEPVGLLPAMVDAGCERLIVHAEACRHLHRTLGAVRELGVAAAVALNPATPPVAVANVVDLVDMVLVMTVNPGFGGQEYLTSMEPKIAETRRMLDRAGRWIDLEVDGGIHTATISGAARSGANIFVTGSGLFRDDRGFAHAVSTLRSLAAAAGP